MNFQECESFTCMHKKPLLTRCLTPEPVFLNGIWPLVVTALYRMRLRPTMLINWLLSQSKHPVFRRRKCSLRDIPRSAEESIPKLGTKQIGNMQKTLVLKISLNNLTKWFACTSKVVKYFGMEFREFASIFVLLNGVPSRFFFRGMVRSLLIFLLHVMECRAFFSTTEWFGTELQEFATLFVHGMVRNTIPRIFCSAEQPEFRRNNPIVPSISSST